MLIAIVLSFTRASVDLIRISKSSKLLKYSISSEYTRTHELFYRRLLVFQKRYLFFFGVMNVVLCSQKKQEFWVFFFSFVWTTVDRMTSNQIYNQMKCVKTHVFPWVRAQAVCHVSVRLYMLVDEICWFSNKQIMKKNILFTKKKPTAAMNIFAKAH